MSRFIMTALILLGASAFMTEAKAQEVVLVRGKIESVTEAPDDRVGAGQADLGVWFRVQLDMVEPLIGRVGSTHAEVTLKIAALPKENRLKDVYVLGEKMTDGSLQAVQWNYVVGGLCVRHELATSYRIIDEIQKLRQSGSVKWDAQCDW